LTGTAGAPAGNAPDIGTQGLPATEPATVVGGPDVVLTELVLATVVLGDVVLEALLPLLLRARATSTIATTTANTNPIAASVSRCRCERRRASSTATVRAIRFCWRR
jgi:hypothetical protein